MITGSPAIMTGQPAKTNGVGPVPNGHGTTRAFDVTKERVDELLMKESPSPTSKI